ncbi:MAG: DUF2550 family protein [Dermatophilaceae bacterium]|nr:DUF2550 domain-containing protein [Intrasporangiaceae bacterium]
MDDFIDDVEQVPLFAAEAVGGALVVGLVLGAALLGYFLLRRRRIAASAPCLSCGLREHGRLRWRSVFVRLGMSTLDCFTVFGLGTRPLRSWSRGEVEVSAPEEIAGVVPGLSDPILLHVRAPGSGDEVELAIERTAYPALRSWSESGPPRPNSVV